MTRDQVFAQAVQLAAAFVANGDIRMGNTTREDSVAMEKMTDLICSIYANVQRCYDRCTSEDA